MNNKIYLIFAVLLVVVVFYWAGSVNLIGTLYVDLSRSGDSGTEIQGNFERLEQDGRAWGWARHYLTDSGTAVVHLWAYQPPGKDGGLFIGKVIANQRHDSYQNHGFSFNIPSRYSGVPIYAYATTEDDTIGNVIGGSPKQVNFTGVVEPQQTGNTGTGASCGNDCSQCSTRNTCDASGNPQCEWKGSSCGYPSCGTMSQRINKQTYCYGNGGAPAGYVWAGPTSDCNGDKGDQTRGCFYDGGNAAQPPADNPTPQPGSGIPTVDLKINGADKIVRSLAITITATWNATNVHKCYLWIDHDITPNRVAKVGSISINIPRNEMFGNTKLHTLNISCVRGNVTVKDRVKYEFLEAYEPSFIKSSSISSDNTHVSGWALMTSYPADSLAIVTELHTRIETTGSLNRYSPSFRRVTVANIPNADANRRTGYEGDHGFEFDVPMDYRDGNSWWMSVWAVHEDPVQLGALVGVYRIQLTK